MKRQVWTGIFLCLVLLVLLPAAAWAEEARPTAGECGDHLQWSFDAASGTLAVSGYGAMSDYADDGTGVTTAPWGVWRDELRRAILGEGLESVGSNAFLGCTP